MDESDSLVLPALSEEQPAVIMGAMGAGFPLLATDIDRSPELVVGGVTDELLKRNDVRSLLIEFSADRRRFALVRYGTLQKPNRFGGRVAADQDPDIYERVLSA